MSTQLFVGGLSKITTDRKLRNTFTPYGVVEDVRVMTYRNMGRISRGFGYVTMAEESEAIAAIEALNGQTIDGSTVKVDRAQ